MIFNLKYLMLPLSIITCINNNGNCMSEQDFIDTNQQNIINDDTNDDTNDGIFAADLIEIMRSFANENTEELSENAKNFIRQLAQHTSTNFENNNLDKEMFDNLLNNNERLKWGQVFSCLYAGAFKSYNVDYSEEAYTNFLKSIRACYNERLITEEQYNKLLDNLLCYNLKKYFDGFNNGYSYRKKFYKVFNVDDNRKYNNSIFKAVKKVFNDDYETFRFIKEIINDLVLFYIYKNRSDEKESYVDQIRKTTKEYIMKLIQDFVLYENDKDKKENNNTNTYAQANFVVEEIKKRVETFYHEMAYRGFAESIVKYNQNRSKNKQKEIPDSTIIGYSGSILRFLERNKFHRIISIGNSIKEIKSKDNSCVYGFSKYIDNIIECYKKDFPSLIENLLGNTEITNEMKNELTEVLGIIAVNENTTIKDLLENKEITEEMKKELIKILNENATIKDLLDNTKITKKMKDELTKILSSNVTIKDLLENKEITEEMKKELIEILSKHTTITDLLGNKKLTKEMKKELIKILNNNNTYNIDRLSTIEDLLDNTKITNEMKDELTKMLENTTIEDLLNNKEFTNDLYFMDDKEVRKKLRTILRNNNINIKENTTIKDLLKNERITNKMKKELTKILNENTIIKENTTIEDLLNNDKVTFDMDSLREEKNADEMKKKLIKILNENNTTIEDLLDNTKITNEMKNELTKMLENTTMEDLLNNKEFTNDLYFMDDKEVRKKLRTILRNNNIMYKLKTILRNNNINIKENITIKDLLKNKKITDEMKDKLNKILESASINENTTIKDLIDKQQKLLQCAILLSEYKQKLNEENTQKLKKNLDEIIDIINVLTKFVSKIDIDDSKIMDFTLKELKGTDKDKAKNEIKEKEDNNKYQINTSSNQQNEINEDNNESEINTNQHNEDASK